MKDGGTAPNQVSHGYCEECKEKTLQEIRTYKKDREVRRLQEVVEITREIITIESGL